MYKQVMIDGQPWNYLIYDDGRLYSMSTKKFLSPDTSTGYARYLLSKDKTKKRMNAHTLVAQAFIPNPNNLPIVNHIDKNRLNNNVTNLEWISYSDNVKKENCSKHEKIILSFTDEEIQNEKWVVFRDGQYSISDLGRLKNNVSGKILHGHVNPVLSYIRDELIFKDKHRETIPRHRIVWEGFHPDDKLDTINHIDGNRTNNRLSNLENITSSENLKKSYTETKVKATRKCMGINLITGEKKIFFSIADAARFLDCNESNIRAALNAGYGAGGRFSHEWQWFNLTEDEYNQALKSSETIESITEKKDLSE